MANAIEGLDPCDGFLRRQLIADAALMLGISPPLHDEPALFRHAGEINQSIPANQERLRRMIRIADAGPRGRGTPCGSVTLIRILCRRAP